jgi:hypothetical protein
MMNDKTKTLDDMTEKNKKRLKEKINNYRFIKSILERST